LRPRPLPACAHLQVEEFVHDGIGLCHLLDQDGSTETPELIMDDGGGLEGNLFPAQMTRTYLTCPRVRAHCTILARGKQLSRFEPGSFAIAVKVVESSTTSGSCPARPVSLNMLPLSIESRRSDDFCRVAPLGVRACRDPVPRSGVGRANVLQSWSD
jgi:hypothetical protein